MRTHNQQEAPCKGGRPFPQVESALAMDTATRMFLLWLFVLIARPQDLSESLQSIRPALTLGIVTLILALMRITTLEFATAFSVTEARQYLRFYLVMMAGIPFAYHARVAFEYIVLGYSTNILFFVLFVLMVDSLKALKAVLFVMCVGAAVYGVFGLTEGVITSGRLGMRGSMFDPNDLAYVLVSLLPLSCYFVLRREGLVKRIVAMISLGASVSVILFTASRGGLIGMTSLIAMFILTNTGGIRWRYKIGLPLAVLGIGVLNSGKINLERFLTLSEIGGDYNVTDEYGRMEIWERGITFALENPITGVGVNCFAMAIGYLRAELHLIPMWQEAHNSYVQVAAEMGLLGLGLFMAIIVTCYKNFARFARPGNGDVLSPEMDELTLIAWLLRMGFVASLISAFFLSQAYSILFTAYFAFSAILRRLEGEISKESYAG